MLEPMSEDELRAELKRAQQMQALAANAGEADAEALWASVIRSIHNEGIVREIELA